MRSFSQYRVTTVVKPRGSDLDRTALVDTIYVVDERKQCEIFGDGIGGIYEIKSRGQYSK